eukprot:6183987-Pleurochrysis_carterae.AAC.1
MPSFRATQRGAHRRKRRTPERPQRRTHRSLHHTDSLAHSHQRPPPRGGGPALFARTAAQPLRRVGACLPVGRLRRRARGPLLVPCALGALGVELE